MRALRSLWTRCKERFFSCVLLSCSDRSLNGASFSSAFSSVYSVLSSWAGAGVSVSPFEVVVNGSRHLHGVGAGVYWQHGGGGDSGAYTGGPINGEPVPAASAPEWFLTREPRARRRASSRDRCIVRFASCFKVDALVRAHCLRSLRQFCGVLGRDYAVPHAYRRT